MVNLNRTLRPLVLVAAGVACLAARQASQSEDQKHWGYSDEGGAIPPTEWGTLPGAALCGTGHQQSPIDLSPRSPGSTPMPLLVYHISPLALINNGHTVQASTDSGSEIRVGGSVFKLTQFHFHAPSEHTVEGRHFPLEIHFVHVDAGGQPAAVVGVLVQQGQANAAYDQLMRRLPGAEGITASVQGPIDLAKLLPVGGFWHYSGSLTTPPCTEGIQWYVMEHPIEMSREQISNFTSLARMAHTARPVQAVGDRIVERLER